MPDTLFDKIARHEIPADIVYEDEHAIGFTDVNPQAPTHVLFVPRESIPTLDDATPAQAELLGRLLLACAAYARDKGLAEDGYRVVINCNTAGGQTVYQLHFHLLGGRTMHWPPG
jgi:histidine triad (HIT) family protein